MEEYNIIADSRTDAKMCIAQYDIDKLQKMLDDELVRRSKANNELLETTIVNQGSSCTVFVPMHVWKSASGNTLTSPVGLEL